ncbi:MAG: tetratricopeptide repeat protein [Ghiorsea sp.]|nr:tetratricopeptide repeat protein [Ghiorsea sp.]
MIFKLTTFCCVLLFIAGCSTASKKEIDHQEPPRQHTSNTKAPVALEKMNIQFLYLSAQQALHQGQPALSVRFLKALVHKEPHEIIPRFELVDLLLAGGQYEKSEAKSYMEAMPEDVRSQLTDDETLQYQQLYARSLLANGDVEQAEIILEGLLSKNPEHVEVRLLLVRLYAVHQSYLQAQRVIEQGLALGKDKRLQQLQVQLYLQQVAFKKADATLATMQRDYPEHEDIVLQRAHLAEKQGSGIKAEALLQLFIDTHEETAVQAYQMLAGIYARQNRVGAAIAVYEKLVPLTAADADVLMSLGRLHYQQQTFPKARDYFKQAITQLTMQGAKNEMSEDLATATFYYGASLEASHQWKLAAAEYEKLLTKHRLYLDAQLRLASIAITLKEYDVAEQRLLRLKTSYPHEIGVYESLSGLRLQQQRYQDVISESDQATDLGFSQTLLFNRAVAFEKLRQFEAQDKVLDQILDKFPHDAEALNFYGYSLAEREVRLDDAKEMVEKALISSPDDGYYLDSLAWVLYKQSKYDKALQVQLKAVAAVPNDALMMEHLGDIYWQLGHQRKARDAWKKGLDLGHKQATRVQDKIENGLIEI